SVGSVVYPSELYFFQLTEQPRRMSGVSKAEAVSIREDLMALRVCHFTASDELQQSIRGLVDAHRHGGPYARLTAHTCLYAALVTLIHDGNAARISQPSDQVTAAAKWIWQHVEEPFTVGEVSAVVGLSPARLQTRFRRELHCAVGEYRTRARLHAARRLLEDDESPITEIAYRLGFSSSQYFATVFRQYLGVTPSQYRHRLTAP
ncbi:MAG TPA: AraC family transcriptional regulator, partial [Mycobacteriales bacterium]|nr:AraC family transcriptional regulator [Mycobacteriales bacterium]